MGGAGTRRWRYFIAVIVAAVGLTAAGAVSPVHAVAAGSSITGVVEDTSGTPQENVTVNALDPATDSTVSSTTTGHDGTFTLSVNPGTYNVQFIPSSGNAIKLGSGMEDFYGRRRAVADVPVFRFFHRERIMTCPLYPART